MWVTALLGACIAFWLLTGSLLHQPSSSASAVVSLPADDALAVLAEFGPPESDRVTDAGGQDRGMGVRLFTYASRHVRVIFMARTAGSPPRRVWRLAGVLDPDTNHMLEGVEAVERLKARQ